MTHALDILNVLGVVIGLGSAVMAVIVGAPSVRAVRQKTGDRSWVTALLGLDFFTRR